MDNLDKARQGKGRKNFASAPQGLARSLNTALDGDVRRAILLKFTFICLSCSLYVQFCILRRLHDEASSTSWLDELASRASFIV